MGKYMRKSKGAGGVTVMELSQGALGVRTRARALSLEKDSKNGCHSEGGSFEPAVSEPTQISYLELRSRRLEKIVSVAGHSRGARKGRSECRLSDVTNSDMLDDCSSRLAHSEEVRHALTTLEATAVSGRGRQRSDENRGFAFHMEEDIRGSLNAGIYSGQSRGGRGRAPAGAAHSRSNSRSNSVSREISRGILTRNQRKQEMGVSSRIDDMDVDTDAFCSRRDADNLGVRNCDVEASFGENRIEEGFSVRDSEASQCRLVRESTPSSQAREVEAPGSATGLRSGRGHDAPSTPPGRSGRRSLMEMEIEEFFAQAEGQEQRRFAQRYNFDPVNDVPLPGRYEWISLQPDS